MKIRAILFISITFGLLSVISVFYVYHFENQINFSFSPKIQDWGALGSYIGGVLGAVFGFISFILLVITVLQQERQIEQQMERQINEDLTRPSRNQKTRLF